MKLDKTAALAEIVSSVAILITLAYLAIQTSQTNAALTANSRQASMETEVSIIMGILDHPEAVNASARDDNWQRRQLLSALVRLREFSWYQYQNEILDEAIWQGYVNTLRRILDDDLGREYWASIEGEVDPEFYAYITDILDDR
jgi:hypothetical protein